MARIVLNDGRVERDDGPWIVEGHAASAEPRDGSTAGERALCRELIELAVREANLPPCETRDEARAWLLDLPRFTARFCAEAIGIDYDAMIAALQRKWTEADAIREARIEARRHTIQ